jgi:hypothetical protein
VNSTGSKSNLKDSKDLLIGSFYMPHRNNKDMELENHRRKQQHNNNRGLKVKWSDPNCPDIQWETPSLKHEASDKEVQRTLIDITS